MTVPTLTALPEALLNDPRKKAPSSKGALFSEFTDFDLNLPGHSDAERGFIFVRGLLRPGSQRACRYWTGGLTGGRPSVPWLACWTMSHRESRDARIPD